MTNGTKKDARENREFQGRGLDQWPSAISPPGHYLVKNLNHAGITQRREINNVYCNWMLAQFK